MQPAQWKTEAESGQVSSRALHALHCVIQAHATSNVLHPIRPGPFVIRSGRNVWIAFLATGTGRYGREGIAVNFWQDLWRDTASCVANANCHYRRP